MNIPVVDISSSNPDAPAQLLNAAKDYGFVFVENNGDVIPRDQIAELFQLSEEFFASPVEIKEEVSIGSNQAGKNHGWLKRGVEMLDPATQKQADIKEALNIGAHTNGQLDQPLPQPLQPHLKTLTSFQDSCDNLCRLIFTHFATALSIEEDWFVSRHDRHRGPSGTVLRLLYYPYIANSNEDDIRAGAHSDFGSVTLLFQLPGQPGLEIKTPEGRWAAVPVDPLQTSNSAAVNGRKNLPILVNIGDLLEDWTGGLLKSTVHRVMFPRPVQGDGTDSNGADRYSIAYFCHPLDDARLDPVPSKLVQEHAARTGKGSIRNGTVLTAKDHLMERLAATYHIK